MDELSETKINYLNKWVEGPTVLDLGCGGGGYSTYLANKGLNVTAIDIEPPVLKGVRVLKADLGKNWPLNSDRFDTVLAFDFVEHVMEEDFVLKNLSSACKKRLILSVPQTDSGRFKAYNLAYYHYTDRTHQRTYTPEQIKGKLESAGFRILDWKEEGPVMPHIVGAFARWRWFGWLLEKGVSVLCRIGLLHKPYSADLFVVADKK